MEHFLERLMFASRWLLAPFYIGLVGAIAILLVKFVKEFVALLPQVLTLEGGQVMVGCCRHFFLVVLQAQGSSKKLNTSGTKVAKSLMAWSPPCTMRCCAWG